MEDTSRGPPIPKGQHHDRRDLDQLKLERFNANSLQAIGLIECFQAGDMAKVSPTSTSTTATSCEP